MKYLNVYTNQNRKLLMNSLHSDSFTKYGKTFKVFRKTIKMLYKDGTKNTFS